jgi:hypothetical protein
MQTTDINLSAYLVAKGQALVDARPIEYGRKYEFEFTDDEIVQRLTQEYYLGKGLINPYEYVIAQKTLRNIILNYKPKTVNYVKGTTISKDFQR